MKFSSFAVLAFHAIGVLSVPSSSAEAECGALGVMDWSKEDIPADFDRSKLRKCKEHPLSTKIHSEVKENENILEARKCSSAYGKRMYGCSKGYCWKNCGDLLKGEWCWQAYDYGKGSWITCKSDERCNARINDDTDSHGCGVGDCKDCGCGGCG